MWSVNKFSGGFIAFFTSVTSANPSALMALTFAVSPAKAGAQFQSLSHLNQNLAPALYIVFFIFLRNSNCGLWSLWAKGDWGGNGFIVYDPNPPVRRRRIVHKSTGLGFGAAARPAFGFSNPRRSVERGSGFSH
jgi:hypothetical protein